MLVKSLCLLSMYSVFGAFDTYFDRPLKMDSLEGVNANGGLQRTV